MNASRICPLGKISFVATLALIMVGCDTTDRVSDQQDAPKSASTSQPSHPVQPSQTNQRSTTNQSEMRPIDEGTPAPIKPSPISSTGTATVRVHLDETSETKNESESPQLKKIAYKEGVVLNYPESQVEIDSKVILRQGELELLVWSKSPTPKGHETILMTEALSSTIYEALGLMGAQPGSPPYFDFETKTAHDAKGDSIDVLVRYQKDGKTIEHSICDWVINKSSNEPLEKRAWVFCGSRKDQRGRFSADVEGTLITVVDFPSSLLSLAESHSESNAELWLIANASAIPEIDTPVTVILRPRKETNP